MARRSSAVTWVYFSSILERPVLSQFEKRRAVDADEVAPLNGHEAGAPRRVVEKRHLAQHRVRLHYLEDDF